MFATNTNVTLLAPNTRFKTTAQNLVASLPFWVRSRLSPAAHAQTLDLIEELSKCLRSPCQTAIERRRI
jgi:hypothetical protein